MGFYPVSLQLARRPCLVIGGGEVAARKVEGLLACEAAVSVISPDLTPELAARHRAGEFSWREREYRPGDLAGFFLVIAATDDTAAQARIHGEAEAGNILLNVADVPKWCNLILPAVVRRGALTIAISTGGASPALAGKLRRELEQEFGCEYEALLQLLAGLRPLILARGGDHRQNRRIFQALVAADLVGWISRDDWLMVRRHVAATLDGAGEAAGGAGGAEEALAWVEQVRRDFTACRRQ